MADMTLRSSLKSCSFLFLNGLPAPDVRNQTPSRNLGKEALSGLPTRQGQKGLLGSHKKEKANKLCLPVSLISIPIGSGSVCSSPTCLGDTKSTVR